MKLIIASICFITFITACGPHEVQYHEPNAKWKGTVTAAGSTAILKCCNPGDNCAKQGVFMINLNTTFRSYIDNNNIAGFFANENWQELFPSLIDRPDVIALIIEKNPRCQFTTDGRGFVIFKDSNGTFNDPGSILFAVTEKMDDGDTPCPPSEQ